MSDRVFVDTSVFVYLFDVETPQKQAVSREVLKELSRNAVVVVSTQVLQEFYVSVTRKLEAPLPAREAREATERLAAYTLIQIDAPLILGAIDLSQRETISFRDAMIVRAGVEAGCTRIVSEDLQHGRSFGETRIENPFLSGQSA